MYFENLMSGQQIVHRIDEAGWVLDFALNGMVKINEITLPEGFWRLSYIEAGDRTIRVIGEHKSEVLSVALHENPYADTDFVLTDSEGEFKATFAYPILKIISYLKNPPHGVNHGLWVAGYIQLLIAQLKQRRTGGRCFKYRELKIVYEAITNIENLCENFPLPAELVRMTGMKKGNFQKVCLALYGQSAQKIIQHIKMAQAFRKIALERETIANTSALLGYRHSPNFITAFHEHFAVTPMDVLQS